MTFRIIVAAVAFVLGVSFVATLFSPAARCEERHCNRGVPVLIGRKCVCLEAELAK